MTRQEEIKEGLISTLGCVQADLALSYLHSQGVVIKVERELPKMPVATDGELKARESGKCQFIRQGEYFNTWYCGLTGETARQMEFCKKWSGDCNPEDCIAEFKADYVAVEPLIQGGK